MLAKALRVGQRVKIKDLNKNLVHKVVLKEPHVIDYGHQKFIVIFKYGVIVFWNIPDDEIKEFTLKITRYIIDPLDEPYEEHISLKEARTNAFENGLIKLKNFDVQEVAIVSEVLSRSVALDYFESAMEDILNEFGNISKDLSRNGKTKFSSRQMLQKVGVAMSMQHNIVSQIAMLDKPEIIWENSELDKFYNELYEEYEIPERYETLNHKLDMIFRDIELIMNYLEAKRAFFVEVVIVLLIVLEIGLFIIEQPAF